MPVSPYPPKLSKADREAQKRAEEREARLHLSSLLSIGVLVMGLVLATVVVIAVLALAGHH